MTPETVFAIQPATIERLRYSASLNCWREAGISSDLIRSPLRKAL
jgi:hypothetical protein